jgi:hypothetical protein
VKALRAVLATATAAAMGLALAALPHGENDPCIDFRSEEGVAYPPIEYSLFPLGIRCVPGEFLGPSVAATIAWMLVAGALVAAALWRPTKFMRGALVGAATLSLMGAFYVRYGPFAPVFISTAVLATPIAFAVARFAALLLVPIVLFVWAFPYCSATATSRTWSASRPARRGPG